jgi:hypothetical protein
VHLKEYFEELLVANYCWVEGYFDHFGMTSLLATDLFVGGVFGVLSRVFARFVSLSY